MPLLVVLMLPCIALHAKDQDDPLSYDRHLHRIFRKHCFECHNSEDLHGDVDLKSAENLRLLLKNRRQWEAAREVLKSGEMPPDEEDQPSDEQRELMIRFLDRTLDALPCDESSNPETPPVRRLTRHQYDLTVADFTGLNLKFSETFAPDPVSFGFEGASGWQGLTQVVIDQYADAATKIRKRLLGCKKSHPNIYKRFFALPGQSDIESLGKKERESLTRKQFTFIVRKAHRGPVASDYIDALMEVYRTSWEVHQKHDLAVGDVVRGILMSPRFFMRLESSQGDGDSGDVVITKVDDVGLANRLSYFLWSAPPDNVLLKVAAAGTLNDPEEIRKQTKRMLKHNRVRSGLGKEFFGQWLQVKDLATHTVNTDVFPGFNERLRSSMVGEVDRFVAEMVQRDLSVSSLIDSDFTFLDKRLAAHYSLTDARDQAKTKKAKKPHLFVRVRLPDRRRGGLLTSAALLTLQADPGRTNIPRRGNFVAGTFLGDPPPPPPPDVPPLKEHEEGGKSMTLREVFMKHREDPGCASCHAKMDPIGFALENFDGIGRWRKQDNGLPIDTSGELPSGEHLDGVISLKDFLLEKQDRLARSITESLIVYAFGRSLTPEDECIVRDAVEECEEQDGRFSAIILAIVTSPSFRFRSNQ